MRLFGLTLFFLVLPVSTSAAIIINEVAWMGDGDSANHEWIELYNTGESTVDLDGWNLTDGMNLSIDLSGSISGKSFAVLERTSDESAPGSAFLIYTGSLVNTGATLSLKRSDGSLEDRVAGGEDWENIGGDNTTKETAQYTASGWVTALPTPGSQNNTEDTSSEEVEKVVVTSSAGKIAKPVKSAEPKKLSLPGSTLELSIVGRSQVYVNQEVNFEAEPSGIGNTLMNSLIYDWNFGDGSTGKGKEAKHTFAYPGKYVVTAFAEYKRQSKEARHEITVLPLSISFTRNSRGDLQINNDSPYEIDLSGYTVSGTKTFIFPPRSILLQNQTITIPAKEIGANATMYDNIGNEFAYEAPPVSVLPGKPVASNYAPMVSREADTTEVLKIATTTPQAVQTISIQKSNYEEGERDESWPYYALFVLIGVSVLGITYNTRNSNA